MSDQTVPRLENIEGEMKDCGKLVFMENEGSYQCSNTLIGEKTKSPDSLTAPKRHEKDSLDPLNFNNICEDIQGLVMQHFTGKDLLAMSEVSKDWNNIVEAVSNEKNVLNLSRKPFKLEDIDFLTRKDQNFTEIVMDLGDFCSVPISLFAESVEKLKIINDNLNSNESVKFSKLKSLDLQFNTDMDKIHDYFWNPNFAWILQLGMDGLEELKITTPCSGAALYCCCTFYHVSSDCLYSTETWLQFLKGLKNLKYLDLGRCSCFSTLESFNKSQLQVETLRFKQYGYYKDHSGTGITLGGAMKKLTVICPVDLRFAFEDDLPQLTTLEIEFDKNQNLWNYSKRGDELPVSRTIKNLSIKLKTGEIFKNEQLDAVAKVLLKAVPELETFFISKLNSDLMRFIAATNLKLKTVEYGEVKDGTFEEYEEMKQSQLNFNRSIKVERRRICFFPQSLGSPTAAVSKSHEKESLDPSNFNNICEDIQSLMMQHFTGKDLLKMSEVSKAWNKFVKPEINEKVIRPLLQKPPKIRDIEVLAKKLQNLKEISIDREVYSGVPITLFADTVEKLKIINNEPKGSLLNLPKLKSLELNFNSKDENFEWILLLKVDNLEELKITNRCFGGYYCAFCYIEHEDDDYEVFQNIWTKFFKNLKNLKHLDLGACSSHITYDSLNMMQHQLESFRFQPESYVDDHDYHFAYYYYYVNKTLKKLTMIRPMHLGHVFTGGCPELTTLELEDYTNRNFFTHLYPEYELPVSNSIKNLSIKLKDIENINIEEFNTNVKALLKLIPELETFFITKLTSGLIKFISETNLKLKTVKFDEIEEGTMAEYEEMKQTQQEINRDIQFIYEV